MPTQSKGQRVIFLILPFVFVFFIIDPPGGTVFPVGLLIYWMTTNLWTVGQGIVTRGLRQKSMPEPVKRSSRTPPKASRRTAPPRSRRRHAAGAEAGGTAAQGQAKKKRALGGDRGAERRGDGRDRRRGEVGGSARARAAASRPRQGAVEFQVVAEGERGLLGVGYTPARVVATVSEDGAAGPVDEPPPDESELASLVRELVTHITAGMGVQCRVDVDEREDAVVATCSGRDLGLLIGRHGQTIDAVQYLVNAILARRIPGTPAVVDAAGYRARPAEASLSAIARRAADDAARRSRRARADDGCRAKIVHVELKDASGVETTSEGTEPNRFVVVFPSP